MNNMRQFLTICFLVFNMTSCQKNDNSHKAVLYYKVDVNGQTENVQACGTSDYVCQFLGDTAMFVGIGCGGQTAGFYLKGKYILDGTYELNDINQASYRPNASSHYVTNKTNKGTLTISTTTDNGIIMLKGLFEFKGIDTITGDVIIFNRGSFLMKKRWY